MGQPKSLLDISMAANFSPKYYAEVSNRVNTLQEFAIADCNYPVFLTITLNGCFRKALNGDFSTFSAVDKKYLPSHIKRKMRSELPLTIRDLVDILNYQWCLFIKRFRDKFKGVNTAYIRCFEPHKKDGVPHIHALFYAPKNSFSYMFKIYKDIFNAPQNLKSDKLSKEQIANGETYGFQTTINNPSGYVMKYITKTFLNLKETDKLDELSTWYVKHKVRRFMTSKTNVPLWVYRKINFISTFQDFYHLNDFKNDPECFLEWNKNDDYISIRLPHRGEELIYLDGRLEFYVNGRLFKVYDKERPTYLNKSFKNYKIPSSNEMTINRIWREIERFRKMSAADKPVSRLKDYELFTYYSNLDKESADLKHLAYVENLLFDRDMGNLCHLDKKHDLNNVDILNFYDREVLHCPF